MFHRKMHAQAHVCDCRHKGLYICNTKPKYMVTLLLLHVHVEGAVLALVL